MVSVVAIKPCGEPTVTLASAEAALDQVAPPAEFVGVPMSLFAMTAPQKDAPILAGSGVGLDQVRKVAMGASPACWQLDEALSVCFFSFDQSQTHWSVQAIARQAIFAGQSPTSSLRCFPLCG